MYLFYYIWSCVSFALKHTLRFFFIYLFQVFLCVSYRNDFTVQIFYYFCFECCVIFIYCYYYYYRFLSSISYSSRFNSRNNASVLLIIIAFIYVS